MRRSGAEAMPELIWDGKYDEHGRRPAPLRVSLPFQTVETINESAQARQRSLFFTDDRNTEWRNRLIWGDKKYVLPALLDDFAGQVDLIYIDPPFATGQDFSFSINANGSSFTKEPSMIEVKAYGCGSRRGTSCGQRDCPMRKASLVHSVTFSVEMEPPVLVEVAVAA